MSEIKHTPGPWSASQEDNNNEWGVDAGKWGIAICADSPGDGTAEANARLIAAAPELLEACIDLLDFIDYVGETDDESVSFAREVITKATGEEP